MTKLIIIRHGESMGNYTDTFTGFTDMELSEKGREQARMAAAYLKDVKIDKVYSSDLKRAYETAKIVADVHGLDVEKCEKLREIYAGDWENRLFDDLETVFADDYKVWLEDVGNAVCTNGESVAELLERVCDEVERIAKENDGKTVFIATHATPVKCLLTKFNNQTLDDMKYGERWVKNASLAYITYEDGKFTVDSYNNTEHLSGLITQIQHNV